MSMIGLLLGFVIIAVSFVAKGTSSLVLSYAGLIVVLGSAWLAFRNGKRILAIVAIALALGILIAGTVVQYTLSQQGTVVVDTTISSDSNIPHTIVVPTDAEIVNVGTFLENDSTLIQVLVRVEGPQGQYRYEANTGACSSDGMFASNGYQDEGFITRIEFFCEDAAEIVSIGFDNDVLAAWNVSANRNVVN